MSNRWGPFKANLKQGALMQVKNQNLYLYERIEYLAVATTLWSNHINFKERGIADSILVLNKKTGLLRSATAPAISDAIQTLIHKDKLDPISCARCLVLPDWLWKGGVGGEKSEYVHCAWHDRKDGEL